MRRTKKKHTAGVDAIATPHQIEKGGRPPIASWDWRSWWGAVVLAAITLATFAPAIGNSFVSWDDDDNFVRNRWFLGLGWPQLRWAWTTFHLGVYQPLAWGLLSAESAAWGLDPRGYHAASVFLHAVNTVILYVLVRALLDRSSVTAGTGGRRDRAAGLGAGLAVALFAVHPLRTEVVAWASCQPYLPCAMFAMLSVLAYLHAHPASKSTRPAWTVVSLVLFAAALLSHAVAVSVPAILVILDFYPLGRIGPGRWRGPAARTVWLEKIPFFALTVVFTALAIHAKAQSGALVAIGHHGIAQRLAQSFYGICFYVIKTVFPVGIAALYPLTNLPEPTDPRVILCVGAVLGASIGALLACRRLPGVLAAWLAYVVILAPNLGLVQVSQYIAADRYSYFASLSFVVLGAAGLTTLINGPAEQNGRGRILARGSACAGLCLVVALAAMTWQQCRTWADSVSLWTHAVDHGGDRSAAVRNYLGLALARAGRYEEAMTQLRQSAALDSRYADAHLNIGFTLMRQKRYEQAGAELKVALQLDPSLHQAHHNLGLVLARQNRLEEAVEHFRESLRLRPDYDLPRLALSQIQEQIGKLEPGR
jgi:Tfp pilus assembly protein PilF